MDSKTQSQIISILGYYALLSLLCLFLLIGFTKYETNLILALIPVTTTPVSILGGFIAGKSLTEKQEEDFKELILSSQDEEPVTENEGGA